MTWEMVACLVAVSWISLASHNLIWVNVTHLSSVWIVLFTVWVWYDDMIVRLLEWQSRSCGFDSAISFHMTTVGKLFTFIMPLIPDTGQRMLISCGWKIDCRSVVYLPRVSRLSDPREGNEYPHPCPGDVRHTLPLLQ